MRSLPSALLGGPGVFKGYKAKIEVEPDATPRYFKACTFPYAMRETVEEQLD